MTRAERRDQKKNRSWYKKHLASNRKALQVVINAKNKREVNK